MKKIAIMMSLFCLLLLAACGNDSSNEGDQDSNQSNEETIINNNKDANTDTYKDETNEQDHTDNSAQPSQKPLTYQLNGETIEENAILTNSDNQGYSIYVLPSFTLTGEEPRKDTLYVNDADQNFMRIELLSDDVNWEQYEQNIAVELEYYNSDITEPTDANLQMENASIFETSNGSEMATIYLIKDENQPMKLTMFTGVDQDYRSAFVEMAKTIVKNQ